MKNYKLDTSLLPQVWVVWDTVRDGKTHYLNCKTGKQKYAAEKWMIAKMNTDYDYYRTDGALIYHGRAINGKMWVPANSPCEYLYGKYHKDSEKFELAIVRMDTCRQEVPRTWRFIGERYFIGKDKTIEVLNRQYPNSYTPKQWYTAWNGKQLLATLLRTNSDKELLKEFKKFIGADYFTIGNGSAVDITANWHIQKWFETVQKTKTVGKQQQIVNDLTSIPLSDTSGLAQKYPPKETDRWTRLSSFMYFERINDEWCVLRVFKHTDNDIVELWRVYFNDKTVRICSPSKDGWIPSKQPHTWWGSLKYFANPEEASEKCDRLKYIINALDYESEQNLADVVVKVLRFPEFEQLIKLGGVNFVKNASHSYTPKADMKFMFGNYYNEKETNVLRKIGMTKKQLDKVVELNSYSYDYNAILSRMRSLFGDDLSYMDIDSFGKYLTMCRELNRRWYANSHINSLGLDQLKFYKNLCRIGEKNNQVYGIVSDLICGYMRLNQGTQPEIDWYFDCYSDCVRLHDAIDELRRQQDAERRAMWNMEEAERLKKQEELRKKIDEDRQKYEYAEDDYIIRLPKDLNEIIREGNMQRICIGSYTGRHAEGQTNLFFLRKVSEPSVPFYAIEMKNDNIIQIHGYGNKWLGNDPDAIPTVIRWLRKNGIKCDDKILTCKARGYGSTNDYVPMPQVD